MFKNASAKGRVSCIDGADAMSAVTPEESTSDVRHFQDRTSVVGQAEGMETSRMELIVKAKVPLAGAFKVIVTAENDDFWCQSYIFNGISANTTSGHSLYR